MKRVFKPGLNALTDPRRHADLAAKVTRDKRDSRITAARLPSTGQGQGIELEFTPDEAKVMALEVVNVLFNHARPLAQEGPTLELALIRLSRLCLNQSFSNLADHGVQKQDIIPRIVQCWQLYPVELAKEALNCIHHLCCRAESVCEQAVGMQPLMELILRTIGTPVPGPTGGLATAIRIISTWAALSRSFNGPAIRQALFSNGDLMRAIFSQWEHLLNSGGNPQGEGPELLAEITYFALQYIRPSSGASPSAHGGLWPSMDQVATIAWPMCARTMALLQRNQGRPEAPKGCGESLWDMIACIKYMGSRGPQGASLVLESPVAMQLLLQTLSLSSPDLRTEGSSPELVLDALYACGALASCAADQLQRHPIAGTLFPAIVRWTVCPNGKMRHEAFNVFIFTLSGSSVPCMDLLAKLELFQMAVYRIGNQAMDSAITAKEVDQAVALLSIAVWHMEGSGSAQGSGLAEHLPRFLLIVPSLLATCFIAVSEAGVNVERCSNALSTLVRLWPHIPRAEWYRQMATPGPAGTEFHDTLQDLVFDDSQPIISANASLLLEAMNSQDIARAAMDTTGDDSGMYYSF